MGRFNFICISSNFLLSLVIVHPTGCKSACQILHSVYLQLCSTIMERLSLKRMNNLDSDEPETYQHSCDYVIASVKEIVRFLVKQLVV